MGANHGITTRERSKITVSGVMPTDRMQKSCDPVYTRRRAFERVEPSFYSDKFAR